MITYTPLLFRVLLSVVQQPIIKLHKKISPSFNPSINLADYSKKTTRYYLNPLSTAVDFIKLSTIKKTSLMRGFYNSGSFALFLMLNPPLYGNYPIYSRAQKNTLYQLVASRPEINHFFDSDYELTLRVSAFQGLVNPLAFRPADSLSDPLTWEKKPHIHNSFWCHPDCNPLRAVFTARFNPINSSFVCSKSRKLNRLPFQIPLKESETKIIGMLQKKGKDPEIVRDVFIVKQLNGHKKTISSILEILTQEANPSNPDTSIERRLESFFKSDNRSFLLYDIFPTVSASIQKLRYDLKIINEIEKSPLLLHLTLNRLLQNKSGNQGVFQADLESLKFLLQKILVNLQSIKSEDPIIKSIILRINNTFKEVNIILVIDAMLLINSIELLNIKSSELSDKIRESTCAEETRSLEEKKTIVDAQISDLRTQLSLLGIGDEHGDHIPFLNAFIPEVISLIKKLSICFQTKIIPHHIQIIKNDLSRTLSDVAFSEDRRILHSAIGLIKDDAFIEKPLHEMLDNPVANRVLDALSHIHPLSVAKKNVLVDLIHYFLFDAIKADPRLLINTKKAESLDDADGAVAEEATIELSQLLAFLDYDFLQAFETAKTNILSAPSSKPEFNRAIDSFAYSFLSNVSFQHYQNRPAILPLLADITNLQKECPLKTFSDASEAHRLIDTLIKILQRSSLFNAKAFSKRRFPDVSLKKTNRPNQLDIPLRVKQLLLLKEELSLESAALSAKGKTDEGLKEEAAFTIRFICDDILEFCQHEFTPFLELFREIDIEKDPFLKLKYLYQLFKEPGVFNASQVFSLSNTCSSISPEIDQFSKLLKMTEGLVYSLEIENILNQANVTALIANLRETEDGFLHNLADQLQSISSRADGAPNREYLSKLNELKYHLAFTLQLKLNQTSSYRLFLSTNLHAPSQVSMLSLKKRAKGIIEKHAFDRFIAEMTLIPGFSTVFFNPVEPSRAQHIGFQIEVLADGTLHLNCIDIVNELADKKMQVIHINQLNPFVNLNKAAYDLIRPPSTLADIQKYLCPDAIKELKGEASLEALEKREVTPADFKKWFHARLIFDDKAPSIPINPHAPEARAYVDSNGNIMYKSDKKTVFILNQNFYLSQLQQFLLSEINSPSKAHASSLELKLKPVIMQSSPSMYPLEIRQFMRQENFRNIFNELLTRHGIATAGVDFANFVRHVSGDGHCLFRGFLAQFFNHLQRNPDQETIDSISDSLDRFYDSFKEHADPLLISEDFDLRVQLAIAIIMTYMRGVDVDVQSLRINDTHFTLIEAVRVLSAAYNIMNFEAYQAATSLSEAEALDRLRAMCAAGTREFGDNYELTALLNIFQARGAVIDTIRRSYTNVSREDYNASNLSFLFYYNGDDHYEDIELPVGTVIPFTPTFSI